MQYSATLQKIPLTLEGRSIILFDGVCNLCNGFVQFIIRRDSAGKFQFCSLQSLKAGELLKEFDCNPTQLSTVIFIEGQKIYTHSTAVLRIIKKMGGLWPLLYILIIIPPFIRNPIYKFVARYRYKLFGKKDECMIPTLELRARFLE